MTGRRPVILVSAHGCCPARFGRPAAGLACRTWEAVYEGGLLRLAHPLPLDEHQRVRVTVHPEPTLAEQTAGLMGWRGSVDDAEYFASNPELDFPQPPEET